jgi:hypothetical protein
MKIEDHNSVFSISKIFKVLLKRGIKETSLEAGQAEKGIVWL